jgi:hypothetical protein
VHASSHALTWIRTHARARTRKRAQPTSSQTHPVWLSRQLPQLEACPHRSAARNASSTTAGRCLTALCTKGSTLSRRTVVSVARARAMSCTNV